MTSSDTPTLFQDAALDEPLRRVAYEAGMLLGLEATREEQGYHRRRLTRHQYWLHGMGTLAGLRVWIDPATAVDQDQDMRVRLLVGPGIGIDGLGREILVQETHCLDLRDWLDAQDPARLSDGFDDAADLLHPAISARFQDCPVAAQPVLARKLNLGTDPVAPSRISDGVLLELDAIAPDAALNTSAWPLHPALDGLPPALTQDEQDLLAALDPNDPVEGAERERLSARLRLLHLFDAPWHPPELESELAALVRLPLARLTLSTADPVGAIVNPARIGIDNLARPFVQAAPARRET